jgi:hypothetical protein
MTHSGWHNNNRIIFSSKKKRLGIILGITQNDKEEIRFGSKAEEFATPPP